MEHYDRGIVLYDRDTVKTIIDLAQGIMEHSKNNLFMSTFGVRIQEEDTETIGQEMTHTSCNFGGDFEDAFGPDYKEELDGVSSIGVDRWELMDRFEAYPGRIAYLLATCECASGGYAAYELILPKPVVLAKYVLVGGRVVEIERIKN